MTWISVKEILPNEDEEVLAITEEKNIYIALWSHDWGGPENWIETRENMQIDIVTHWQPLPEPPEIEE